MAKQIGICKTSGFWMLDAQHPKSVSRLIFSTWMLSPGSTHSHSAGTGAVPRRSWASEHCSVRDVLQTAAVM